ncbi:hypothetical protein BU17DRAFT_66185 [Hysterangium stoloniferum]|nr:hypothetical protein BU17DRAFT_66185 [Hysterangium stoloniferum]
MALDNIDGILTDLPTFLMWGGLGLLRWVGFAEVRWFERKGWSTQKKEMGGTGPDATIVATDAHDAFNFGLALTRKHGTLVIVGVMLCDLETAVEAMNMVVTTKDEVELMLEDCRAEAHSGKMVLKVLA